MTLTKKVLIGVSVVSLIYELCKLIFTPQPETAEAKCPTCSTREQEEGEPTRFKEKSRRIQEDEEETGAETKFQSCSTRYQEEEPRGHNDSAIQIQEDEEATNVRSSYHSVEDVGTTIECTPGGNVKYTISSKYLDGLVGTSIRSSYHSDNEDIGMAIECTPQGNVKFIIPTKYLDGIQTETNTNITTIAAENDHMFEISLDADRESQDQLRRIFLEADLLHASRGLDADNKTKELVLTILSDAAKYRKLQQAAAAQEASNSEASYSEASNSLILEGVSYSDSSSINRLLAEVTEEASYSDLSSSMY
jgi:hypothetical protein